MGTSERRKRETEALRQKVLDVAEEIIAEEGIRHVTMRRIAASVEYTPTVLYRLFANKDDLMDHLIARGYSGVRSRYEEILQQSPSDPLERLRGILSTYADFALEHPNHYRVWFETSEIRQQEGQFEMKHGRLEFVVFQPWLEAIDACHRAGLFENRDREEVFQVLWTRMHGLISLRLQHPDFPWMPEQKHLTETMDLDHLARGR